MASPLRRAWRARRPSVRARYDEGRVDSGFVDELSDDDLARVNGLLPWRCFTVDVHGRPFGAVAWEGKRADPQPVPDPRIERMDAHFGLAGQRVLEVGCFEGVHTIALCRRAAAVTAVDARVENVVKTIVRCAMFGHHPTVFTCDLEDAELPADRLRADLCHHVGVLYHLADPVRHLERLAPLVGRGLMLDTHVAAPAEVDAEHEARGRVYRVRRYREAGRADPFSGMGPEARWLLLDDLEQLLARLGFAVDVAETRQERNGARALILATRSEPAA
jgi:2-polyprenyl-3-methyl-5-hydroxy-6-metoxy-1,4-benzoquinol methylase